MLTLPLPADSPQVAQLYRMLRALLWLVLLLALASEWLAGTPVPLHYLAVLIAVVGLWLYCGHYWQRRWRLQLWLDLLLLLAFFAGHGGGANPLLTILLLPLAAAAATLGFWHWLALVAAAGAGYALMLLGLEPWLPPGHEAMPHTAGHHLPASAHLWGMWASFMLAAGLSGIFINRLARDGRSLGLRLLQLHQRQGRHAMITASGARAAAVCHHLATPLNNLLLLQEHWQQQGAQGAGWPSPAGEWQDDVQEMGRQLQSCLQALAPLRRAAGEQQSEQLLVRLRTLAEEWQLLNPNCGCSLHWAAELEQPQWYWPDDGLLHHALWNLLDNAARAGGPLRLSLAVDVQQLVISVSDNGPGFPAWLLADQPAPTPPQGMGLGVMLVRTAMELCGGRLQLLNLASGGCARLLLPLAYVQPGGPRRQWLTGED